MRKRDELTDPKSCMSRAGDDEWTFVLLGRDVAAPAAVRAWIDERIRLAKNAPGDGQIKEAEAWIAAVTEEQGLCRPLTWPTPINPSGSIDRLIDEDWLRDHGFRIDEGRNDPRLPVRRLHVALHGIDGRQFMESPDDLCIDVAPVKESRHATKWVEWFVWIAQVEPYRHIHVRKMRYRWEIAKLFEGLTGRVWPGTI